MHYFTHTHTHKSNLIHGELAISRSRSVDHTSSNLKEPNRSLIYQEKRNPRSQHRERERNGLGEVGSTRGGRKRGGGWSERSETYLGRGRRKRSTPLPTISITMRYLATILLATQNNNK